MKRLLILVLIYLNAQISYGMDNAQYRTLAPEDLKTLTAEQIERLQAMGQVQPAQIASRTVSLPNIDLEINARSIVMGPNRVAITQGRSVFVHDFEGNILYSHLFKDLDEEIRTHTISDNGRYVAIAHGGTISIIDANNPGNRRTIRGLHNAFQLAYDHQSKNLAILGIEFSLQISDYKVYLALFDEKLSLIKKAYLTKKTTFQDYDTMTEIGRYNKSQIAISSDNNHIAVVTPVGLFFWNVKNDILKEKTNDANLTHTAVTACDDNTFAVLSVSSQRPMKKDLLCKLIVSIYETSGEPQKDSSIVAEFNETNSEKFKIFDAQLTATPDGLRILLNGKERCVIVDAELCKFLHDYEKQEGELCIASSTGFIKYKTISASTKTPADDSHAQAALHQKHKAKLDATLRRKRLVAAVGCVAGVVAAYGSWKKFKKKKKESQNAKMQPLQKLNPYKK